MMLAALPEGVIPLAVGTVLALGGLSLVLAPLINDGSEAATKVKPRVRTGPAPEASDGAVAALREIEFDRETGKLSDSDYAELKSRYTRAALDELRASDAANASMNAVAVLEIDPVEAAISRARAQQKSCIDCGPRSEPDATYCSNCGRFFPGQCSHCGVPVTSPGSAFCSSCGEVLVAG